VEWTPTAKTPTGGVFSSQYTIPALPFTAAVHSNPPQGPTGQW
jgi:hypothetical protein